MNLGTSKKVIFSSLVFINIFQAANAYDFHKFDRKVNNIVFRKNSFKKNSTSHVFNNSFQGFHEKQYFLGKNSQTLFANLINKQQELIIEADKQFEINNVINANGKVRVSYKGKFLIT